MATRIGLRSNRDSNRVLPQSRYPVIVSEVKIPTLLEGCSPLYSERRDQGLIEAREETPLIPPRKPHSAVVEHEESTVPGMQ